MENTSNYHLKQWEEPERIMMEDFNADNVKLDAALTSAATGGLKIETGSYVGNGTNGANNAITLTFDGKPMVLFVAGPLSMQALRGAEYGNTNNGAITSTTWGENSVSWYSAQTANIQMNESGKTYHYIALVQANG